MGKEAYVAGTVISIMISLALYLTGRREAGTFVGLWAPTILLLGERMAAGRVEGGTPGDTCPRCRRRRRG